MQECSYNSKQRRNCTLITGLGLVLPFLHELYRDNRIITCFSLDILPQKTVIYLLHYNNKQVRSEEHTSELQSRGHLVCRLLLEKKNKCRLIKNMIMQH